MSLTSNLLDSVGAHADRVALRLGDAATTYRELDRDSARAAGLLRDRGIQPGPIGTPIRGVEMRVVDEQGAEVPQGQVGEIAIRGHNVMKGYWRRPEETATGKILKREIVPPADLGQR